MRFDVLIPLLLAVGAYMRRKKTAYEYDERWMDGWMRPAQEELSHDCARSHDRLDFYLASGAVAHPLVSALGVCVVRSRLVRGVGPGDLVRACAVGAVAGLVKLFPVLHQTGTEYESDQIRHIHPQMILVLGRRSAARTAKNTKWIVTERMSVTPVPGTSM